MSATSFYTTYIRITYSSTPFTTSSMPSSPCTPRQHYALRLMSLPPSCTCPSHASESCSSRPPRHRLFLEYICLLPMYVSLPNDFAPPMLQWLNDGSEGDKGSGDRGVAQHRQRQSTRARQHLAHRSSLSATSPEIWRDMGKRGTYHVGPTWVPH
ncbi:Os03g0603701 [Oryza sativa Japonica Group]|uniref:Os03g0603701 protein n=1 Tax=Oryza sativa subsp. japonica TaxID=39947 RepID=A0A0P0W035_ORYSJ|nr:Os03g0603701 [Oryza sativa Japonica Group]